MKNNRGFTDLVSYVDEDLKDKLTVEEIYHLLLIACNSARDSGAANVEEEEPHSGPNPIDSSKPLESGESWLGRLRDHWDSKIKG